jgi:hypothetical protein
MLKAITTRRYNYIDFTVAVICGIALGHGDYLTLIGVLIVGAIISGALEATAHA